MPTNKHTHVSHSVCCVVSRLQVGMGQRDHGGGENPPCCQLLCVGSGGANAGGSLQVGGSPSGSTRRGWCCGVGVSCKAFAALHCGAEALGVLRSRSQLCCEAHRWKWPFCFCWGDAEQQQHPVSVLTDVHHSLFPLLQRRLCPGPCPGVASHCRSQQCQQPIRGHG